MRPGLVCDQTTQVLRGNIGRRLEPVLYILYILYPDCAENVFLSMFKFSLDQETTVAC